MIGTSNKENERLISGEGEWEKKNYKQKQTKSLEQWSADLWVTQDEALIAGYSVTGEWLQY